MNFTQPTVSLQRFGKNVTNMINYESSLPRIHFNTSVTLEGFENIGLFHLQDKTKVIL